MFTGMWLEALLHFLIVEKLGKDESKKFDRKKYEAKLRLLDCRDEDLLRRIAQFRDTRNLLMHEKAHFDDGEIRKAQDEAENSHAILNDIERYFSK